MNTARHSRNQTSEVFDLQPVDNQAGPESDVDPKRSVDHRDWLPTDRPESTLSKFILTIRHGAREEIRPDELRL